MTENEAREKVIADAVATLAEHFDHVQVLATWDANDHSHRMSRGAGNWYARQGLAHEFINNEVARENANEVAKAIKPEESE